MSKRFVIKKWVGREWYDPKHGNDDLPTYLARANENTNGAIGIRTDDGIKLVHFTADLNESWLLSESESAVVIREFTNGYPFTYQVVPVCVQELAT